MSDTEPKKSHGPWKALFEYGPLILFFVAYTKIKDQTFTFAGNEYQGFIVATALFIPVLLISTAAMWWITGKLSKMQVFTAILVVVFGGLGIWFNDDSFFKMKPTIIYLLFGGVLGFGLLRGQSYLRYMMEEMLPLQDAGWMILTKRFALFFLGLALANEAIWRSMSTDAWVNFKTFGLPIAMFAFIMLQTGLFSKYSADQTEDRPS
ncbi:putative intracellular septation protein A [Amylibacter marinus]|uniref:Inner membrane-spanning protein YciB n=1 Tax=Amylibacter marinus TaxID=1475483 RepID=A0ABQ5VTD1_9RHOB|nr:inner membrane-spanning protein YciB [Amylibacter marinus]GLQ34584.1 putative intracellular septation protein A [Amylibacter marinus]